MGSISALKINGVHEDKIKLLFYQFQNCLDISDYDVVEPVKLKQLCLTFLFLTLQDYAEEFDNPAQELPLYQKLLDKLGEDEYTLADAAFAEEILLGLETEAFIDFDLHTDDSFAGRDFDLAFAPETVAAMPHLVFELQFADAGLLTGITEGMYAYSGLDIFSYKWLPAV